jgi:hypothetical protein
MKNHLFSKLFFKNTSSKNKNNPLNFIREFLRSSLIGQSKQKMQLNNVI